MKIAIVTLLYPPRWMGGTEIASQQIAESLAKRQHEVHVISSWDPGFKMVSEELNFTIHRIKVPRIRFIELIRFWVQIPKVVSAIKPDILLIQSIPTGLGGYLVKKKLNIPYVIWGQGSDVYRNWLFKKLISHLVLKNEDVFFALTHHMENTAKKLGASRISVIPNGTQINKYANLSGLALRKELKIQDNEKVILFVGGLKIIKGLKYLIQAMNEVIKYCPDTKLVLAGSGPELKNLTLQVEKLNLAKNVLFLGGVSHDKIPELMSTADIFVLPSLSEGFPLVIVEAMASGLPVIATNVGGLPEIVKENENGFLIQSKNSNQIAQKIIFLLQNKELRKQMSENSKRIALEYDWDRIAGIIYERIEDIMEESSFLTNK